MTDEFNEPNMSAVPSEPAQRGRRDAAVRQRVLAARLVSRAYRTASEPLRANMLASLLRPLSTLSLVAVASGAFGRFLYRDSASLDMSAIVDGAERYSSDQILELARFVQDVSPETLQQLVGTLADNPMSAAAWSAAALVLLYRKIRRVAKQTP